MVGPAALPTVLECLQPSTNTHVSHPQTHKDSLFLPIPVAFQIYLPSCFHPPPLFFQRHQNPPPPSTLTNGGIIPR